MKKWMLMVFLFIVALSCRLSAEKNDPKPFSALYSDFLIGGFCQGSWLPSEEMTPLLKGGEMYKKLSGSGVMGEFKGSAPRLEEGPSQCVSIDFEGLEKKDPDVPRKSDKNDRDAFPEDIFICCPWNPIPRPVKNLDPQMPVYEKAVREILDQNRLNKAKVAIEQILKADLNGDGVDEILISAANVNSRQAKFEKNTYSIVFLRHVVKGAVKTEMLGKVYYYKDKEGEADGATEFGIAGIADVNGDGKMEILMSDNFYEGSGIQVFEWDGGAPKKVLEAGVGA